MSQDKLNEQRVLDLAIRLVREHYVGLELMHQALGPDCAGAGKDRRHDAIDAYRDLVDAVCTFAGEDRMAFEQDAWAKVGRKTIQAPEPGRRFDVLEGGGKGAEHGKDTPITADFFGDVEHPPTEDELVLINRARAADVRFGAFSEAGFWKMPPAERAKTFTFLAGLIARVEAGLPLVDPAPRVYWKDVNDKRVWCSYCIDKHKIVVEGVRVHEGATCGKCGAIQ